jgi:hypothetical protein
MKVWFGTDPTVGVSPSCPAYPGKRTDPVFWYLLGRRSGYRAATRRGGIGCGFLLAWLLVIGRRDQVVVGRLARDRRPHRGLYRRRLLARPS